MALLLRALSVYFDSRLPFFRSLRVDSIVYDAAGKAFAHGDWTLGRDMFHMSPGYCYFVGVVYSLFGNGPWAIRIVQLLLGLVTIACLYDTAFRLFGSRWGLIGGLVAALYGPFIYFDSQVLAEGLATAFNAAFLWALIRARVNGSDVLRWWILAGLSWGLSVIIRPNALVLALPIAVAGLLTKGTNGQRGKALVIAAAAGAVAILPITLRNLIVAGEPVLVTDSGGLQFYIGNGPDSVGTFHAPPVMPKASSPWVQYAAFREIPEKAVGHHLTSKQVDAYWFHQTWAYVAADPIHWARLMLDKLWLFWSAREISNNLDYTFTRRLQPILGLPLVQFGWIAPFAFLGTLLFFLRGRRDEWLVASTNAILCAANVAVFILARYRISAVPGLILAAVGCVQWMVESGAARAWRRLLPAGIALLPLAVLVWWPQLPDPFDRQYLKLGNAYFEQHELPQAADAYRKSIGLNANNISAHKNLGIVFERLGDRDGARHQWQEVARIASATRRPDYAQAAAAHLKALTGQPP